MELNLYKRGYSLTSGIKLATKSGGGKRGNITGKVSSASFRRLRQFCITHDISGDCWGITLTVPGLDLLAVEEFKKMHHKLCVWANDNLVALVWRVELQVRGQAHLHIVAFTTVQKVVRLLVEWFNLLDALPRVYSRERVGKEIDDLVEISRAFVNGAFHAVDVQQLSGDHRAWRYLVAHMSKGKRDQLGWHGRNWGVCNRKHFADSVPINYQLTEKEYYTLLRWVRRLTRSRVSRRGCSYWLGNSATVQQMLCYIRGNYKLPF